MKLWGFAQNSIFIFDEYFDPFAKMEYKEMEKSKKKTC